MPKKVNKLYLWLTVGICALIAIGLIWWNLYAENKTVITVFLVIDFLIMTFTLQMAIAATFKFKPKPKKYKTASYNLDIIEVLNNLTMLGYTKKETKFGCGYMKIIGKTAYKLSFIDNVEEYLKPVDENERVKQKENFPGLNKCTKFVGFEIFLNYNEKVLERLPEFSFQGKNIFYEGFYYTEEDKILIETNIIEPTEDFKNAVNNLRKDLEIGELE